MNAVSVVLIRLLKMMVSATLNLRMAILSILALVPTILVSTFNVTAAAPLYTVLVRLFASKPFETLNELFNAPLKVAALMVPVVLTLLNEPVVALTVEP